MNWNPYQTFTWTKKQVKAWIDKHGSWAFYDGAAWKIITKKVFSDRYEVKFERTD